VGEFDAIREAATVSLPANATVLVVSGGDDALLHVNGHTARHFPAAHDGSYLGWHPGDSQEAIDRLERERARGAEFLFVPERSMWWLDFYRQLDQYLSDRYRVVSRTGELAVFQLTDPGPRRPPSVGTVPTTRDLTGPLRALVASLVPEDALVAVLQLGDEVVVPELRAWQPPRFADGDAGFVEGLESLRSEGVEYLVVPEPVLGWLGRQPSFADELRERNRLVTRQAHLGEIYELRPSGPPAERPSALVESDGHGGPDAFEQRVSTPAPTRSGGLLLFLRRLVGRWLASSRNGSRQ
jgi:hypothetical protein